MHFQRVRIMNQLHAGLRVKQPLRLYKWVVNWLFTFQAIILLGLSKQCLSCLLTLLLGSAFFLVCQLFAMLWALPLLPLLLSYFWYKLLHTCDSMCIAVQVWSVVSYWVDHPRELRSGTVYVIRNNVIMYQMACCRQNKELYTIRCWLLTIP